MGAPFAAAVLATKVAETVDTVAREGGGIEVEVEAGVGVGGAFFSDFAFSPSSRDRDTADAAGVAALTAAV